MPSPAPLPDPGAMPEPAALHVTEVTRTYPCNACGAQLVFDPAAQLLKCPSCGNTMAIQGRPKQPLAKHDLGTAMRSAGSRCPRRTAGGPSTRTSARVCRVGGSQRINDRQEIGRASW